MFEDLIREIKKLERGVRINVTIPSDGDGYLDRQCPSTECEALFKVLNEDWDTLVDTFKVYCPTCKHLAPSDQWATSEQTEYAKKVAFRDVQNRIDQALRSSASQFNRLQPKSSLINMSMRIEGRPSTAWVPANFIEAMQIQIKCKLCNCRFAVIGSGYFCPSCGDNSVEQTFIQQIEVTRTMISKIGEIEAVLMETLGRDIAHNNTRVLMEGRLQSLVTSFQRLSAELYPVLAGNSRKEIRRNAFQNITEANKIWTEAGGRPFYVILTPEELRNMETGFQRRHLLAHNEGIVDERYIRLTGDKTYNLGQRVVIVERFVLQVADAVEKVGIALIEDVRT